MQGHNEILPEGFVYLSDVDPSIVQSIRYTGHENFVGRSIPGYNGRSIICTTEAAAALAAAHEYVQRRGYHFVVYDAYRPQKAVDFFIAWSQDEEDQARKETYYPYINKSKLFACGYLAKKSGHSRGSTLDLTIIESNKELLAFPMLSPRSFADGREVVYVDDGTVDMGTSFDLLDELSHHGNTAIYPQQLERREFLRKTMELYGFASYDKEWWHYTLRNEPFPGQYFDF